LRQAHRRLDQAVCAAYRASLFTGKPTTSTGMVINELRLSPEHECFGHVLGRAGYQTGYIGKWHLWANQLGHHDEDRNGFIPPGPYRLGFDGFWAAYNFHHVYHDAFYYRDEPKKIPYGDGVYEPDGQTDMAIDFVTRAARGDQPFALFLSWGTPHDPWGWDNVPERFAEPFRDVTFPRPPNYKPRNDPYADGWAQFRRGQRAQLERWQRVYYAMTADLDWNLGRLLAALEDAGVADDTLVVFSSDHGEMFGAQGRRAKNIFYEEAARVPFVLRWPRRIPAGRVTDACLGTPDILPTLLGLLGLPAPEAAEGMDLGHCALGEPGPEPDAALLQGTGTTAAWRDGHEWRALRDKRYTYAVYRRDRSELLFDHQADPFQTTNLAADPEHADTLARFRQRLKACLAAIADTFEACTWYRDHWTRDRNILRGARGGSHDLDALADIIRKHFPS
ncbi:MAG: sulfatase-like hydrolase/transferase, partial [Planctomycetota bacterium]